MTALAASPAMMLRLLALGEVSRVSLPGLMGIVCPQGLAALQPAAQPLTAACQLCNETGCPSGREGDSWVLTVRDNMGTQEERNMQHAQDTHNPASSCVSDPCISLKQLPWHSPKGLTASPGSRGLVTLPAH